MKGTDKIEKPWNVVKERVRKTDSCIHGKGQDRIRVEGTGMGRGKGKG